MEPMKNAIPKAKPELLANFLVGQSLSTAVIIDFLSKQGLVDKDALIRHLQETYRKGINKGLSEEALMPIRHTAYLLTELLMHPDDLANALKSLRESLPEYNPDDA